MAGAKKIECEIEILTTTGSTLKYKYEKEGNTVKVERTLITELGAESTSNTTISSIKIDGQQLLDVAKALDIFDKTTVAP